MQQFVPAQAVVVTNDPSHLVLYTHLDGISKFPDAGLDPSGAPDEDSIAIWFSDVEGLGVSGVPGYDDCFYKTAQFRVCRWSGHDA